MKTRPLSLVPGCLIPALILTLVLGGLLPAMAQARGNGAAPDALAPSGLIFVENRGQFAQDVRFQMLGGDQGLWLTDDAIWLTLLQESPSSRLTPQDVGNAARIAAGLAVPPRSAVTGVNVMLSFPDANPHSHLEPFDPLDTHVSFLKGSDPSRWYANVPVWGGVRYVDLYPGIDLDLTGEQGCLVLQVIARPGANLRAVRLRVDGAQTVAVGPEGDTLQLSTNEGRWDLPLLRSQSSTTEAAVRSLGAAACEVTSPFSPLPARRPGVTMPGLGSDDLLYSTFLGGSRDDHGEAIAIDGSGAIYVAGWTQSADLPVTPGAFDGSYTGGWDVDAFVIKLNPAGSVAEYVTYLGGDDRDDSRGIAVDGSGAAYVTGQTYSFNFPTTPGALDTTYNAGYDAFAVKLNAAGSALEYATFLGGSQDEAGEGIAVDESGAAYIAGWTGSASFPTTQGAFDTVYDAGHEAFVAKLNATGSALEYATLMGGGSDDYASGIALDQSGAVYVFGETESSDLPVTPGAFDTSYNADRDTFVAKLNAAGAALDYASYLGGSGDDHAGGIAFDGSGAAYVTGWSNSADLPTAPGAFDTSYNGGLTPQGDAFVAKLNAAGSALDYATFLGGSEGDAGRAITVDGNGAAYVTGETGSSDFPTTCGAFDTRYSYYDAFAVKLNPAGSALSYGTYLAGGSGAGILLDESGVAYIAGDAWYPTFPTTPGAFDSSYNGGTLAGDAFAAKLSMGPVACVYLPLVMQRP